MRCRRKRWRKRTLLCEPISNKSAVRLPHGETEMGYIMKFNAVYVPIGVGTYHMETAHAAFAASRALLQEVCPEVIVPEDILLDTASLGTYLDAQQPDLVILQNITFANAAYASEVLRRFNCPILLWTLREPAADGGRLKLNSLTGAFSAANAIAAFRGAGEFSYIFGSADEEKVQTKIRAAVSAARLKKELKGMTVTAIGHTPQGFGFGRALDAEMMKNFGVTLESIEARELIEKARSFSDEECADYLARARELTVGLDKMPEKNVKDFARLYKAYTEYVQEHHVEAIASRCWPDFFTSFGTPVCMVLSLLNAAGEMASCEADAYGALSMVIGSRLSGKATFFGDPVALSEEESSITFWHCGMAACSLARPDTGAEVGVHPNRKIGPTMEFGCAPSEKATIFRIGRTPEGRFRFFVASGSVMDKPRQYFGTSIVVKTDTPSREIVENAIADGWEPHYVVVYGDVTEELTVLGKMLRLEVCRY